MLIRRLSNLEEASIRKCKIEHVPWCLIEINCLMKTINFGDKLKKEQSFSLLFIPQYYYLFIS